MKGADAIAEILKREGTEFLACYPRNPLIEACANIGIRPILCRQERVGVGMADGYTRIKRGRINGVFAAQMGPGIENAFPGIAQAYSENVPILVIPVGARPGRYNVRPTFNAVDNYARVTKWATRVGAASEIPDAFRRAYHALRTGRGGPVLLEVGDEVWTEDFTGELDYAPVMPYRAAPDPEAVKHAVKLLAGAKNPVIFAGAGVIYGEATDALVRLAELLPAPVMTTNPGKSAFPENHPLSLGASTSSASKPLFDYLRGADIVLAIGSSLTRTPFGPSVPPGKRIIHATNDAGDINKDYRVEAGLIGDANLVIGALIAALDGAGHGGAQRAEQLGAEVKAAKAAWRKEWSKHLDSDEVPLNQYRIIRDLMATVDRDNTIVTHDSGSPREQLLPTWECTQPGTYMGWGKSTQLGYGLGINMGAKLAAPDKLCMNVMGDAAIGMTGMDLETAARNGIGTLTVVFNNGVMAAERGVLPISIEKYDALLVGGNYAKVAEGLGVASTRVERPDRIIPAIKEAVATTKSGRPFLLEFITKEGYDFSRY